MSAIETYVDQIPANTNAFLAAAKMVENHNKSPPTASWSRILTRLSLGIFAFMFFQAMFLLCQRIQIKEFTKRKYNKLGLLLVNVADASALAYSMFAPMCIVFLSLQVGVEHGWVDESSSLLLFGGMFLFIMPSSGAYLWVCVCQSAALMWDSQCVSKLSNKNRERLQVTIKWGINVVFLVGLISPIPLICVFYGTAYQELRTIVATLKRLHDKLLSAASTFNVQTYENIQLIDMLSPLEKVDKLSRNIEVRIRAAITVYAVATFLTVAVYTPLMFFCMRALYNRSISQKALNSSLRHSSNLQPSNMGVKIRQQIKQLVCYGLAVYVSAASFLPVLFWQLFNSPKGFLMDPTWRAISYHGLTIPFSVTGNIVLLILNLHSSDVLFEIQERRLLAGGISNAVYEPKYQRGREDSVSSNFEESLAELDDEKESGNQAHVCDRWSSSAIRNSQTSTF